jgi:ribosomal protein S27E
MRECTIQDALRTRTRGCSPPALVTRLDNPYVLRLHCATCAAVFYAQPLITETCPGCGEGALTPIGRWDTTLHPWWLFAQEEGIR